MKKKFLPAPFFLYISAFFFNTQRLDQKQGIIELVYTGDQSKPFPVMIFHLPGSIDTKYDSTTVYKFEIAEKSFEKIQKSIEKKRNVQTDSVFYSPYEITVYCNNKTTITSILYFSEVRQIFNDIENQIKNTNLGEEIRKRMCKVLSRLQYEIKSN